MQMGHFTSNLFIPGSNPVENRPRSGRRVSVSVHYGGGHNENTTALEPGFDKKAFHQDGALDGDLQAVMEAVKASRRSRRKRFTKGGCSAEIHKVGRSVIMGRRWGDPKLWGGGLGVGGSKGVGSDRASFDMGVGGREGGIDGRGGFGRWRR